jgi:hypothetical protein
MDSRNIFDYQCHTCKQTKEPGEFGINSQTRKKLVTCFVCHSKRTERAAKLRTSRLGTPAVAAFVHAAPDTTEEEPGIPEIVRLDWETSEEEERCENACFNRFECYGVGRRFTCIHKQCVNTHLALGRCIACGCSELRNIGYPIIVNPASSSSGPAIPEDEEEPDGEPEAANPFSIFITSEF